MRFSQILPLIFFTAASSIVLGHDRVKEETSGLIVTGSHFQRAQLVDGTLAFANHTYIWESVPNMVKGGWFTRLAAGEPVEITIQAKKDLTVYAATADQPGVDLTGWDRIPGETFSYTDHLHTRMRIYQKSISKDEKVTLPQGNWSGMILVVPPEGL